MHDLRNGAVLQFPDDVSSADRPKLIRDARRGLKPYWLTLDQWERNPVNPDFNCGFPIPSTPGYSGVGPQKIGKIQKDLLFDESTGHFYFVAPSGAKWFHRTEISATIHWQLIHGQWAGGLSAVEVVAHALSGGETLTVEEIQNFIAVTTGKIYGRDEIGKGLSKFRSIVDSSFVLHCQLIEGQKKCYLIKRTAEGPLCFNEDRAKHQRSMQLDLTIANATKVNSLRKSMSNTHVTRREGYSPGGVAGAVLQSLTNKSPKTVLELQADASKILGYTVQGRSISCAARNLRRTAYGGFNVAYSPKTGYQLDNR